MNTNTRRGPTAPTSPIRDRADIQRIKERLQRSPRDLALFTLGINTAFRAGDLLSLNVGDVRGRTVLTIKEQKTGKHRTVPLNPAVLAALQPLLNRPDAEPLFVGAKRGTRLTVETLGRLWKRWCTGLDGHYSSHSGRKTFGYQQRMSGASLDLLQMAFGHSSSAITLAYVGIQEAEIVELYAREI